MTTTHKFAKYVGGGETLAPRGWEFKGGCQHCGMAQAYIFIPAGNEEPLLCSNPKCKKEIAKPFPEPPKAGTGTVAMQGKVAKVNTDGTALFDVDVSAALIDRTCKGCGRKYGASWKPGTPLPACTLCGRPPDEAEQAGMMEAWTATKALVNAAAADQAKKPKKPTAQQLVTQQLVKFATPGVCERPGCGKEVWWWNAMNAKNEPTKYIFDRNPQMVFGVKMAPDGLTVVGLEKRTCWISHWTMCKNPPR